MYYASCVNGCVRELQEEVEDLRRRRQQEEQTLREVQEVLRSRDQEFQQLNTKIHSASDRYSTDSLQLEREVRPD